MGLRRAEKRGKRYLNPEPTSVGGLRVMLEVLPQFLTNKEERTPKIPPGPFRTDARVYEAAPASGLRVTWFGHSSSLVEIDGIRLLLDPVWEERASPSRWLGPRRFFAPTLRLSELPRLDAVLISHDHYDHLGAETVRALANARPGLRWIAPQGVGRELRKFGVTEARVTELDWTESTVVQGAELGPGLRVTAAPARHFSGRSLWNRFHTLWASYVLKGQRHSVYYGADSGMWAGFAEIAEAYGPFDLTMLEIGAFHPAWESIHMGPDGAAHAFRAMGAKGLLMPIHWGLFDLALHGWRQPIERITELAVEEGIPLWSPEPGVPSEVVERKEIRSGWWRES